MDTGIRRRSRKPRAKAAKSRSRKSPHTSRKVELPKTMKLKSRKSKSREPHFIKRSHASSGMSLTELQFMARSKGIPFGGLSRAKLIKKLNNYY